MSDATAPDLPTRVRVMEHPETGEPVRLTETLMELEDLDHPGVSASYWVVTGND